MTPDQAIPKEVTFTYVNGKYHRTIHVDGAIGGLCPKTHNIHMAIYSERYRLPDEQAFKVTDAGKIGEKLASDRKSEIMREVEASLIIDAPTASSIANWLQEKVKESEDLGRMIAKRGESEETTRVLKDR